MAPLSFHVDDDTAGPADTSSSMLHQGLQNDGVSIKTMIPLGFTSGVMETIRASKVKMNEWVEREKGKIDAEAESYRRRLQEEQASINKMSTELKMIQKQRGLVGDGGSGTDGDDGENLAARKRALEEQITQAEVEIMKLQAQRDNRGERMIAIGLEESKQRLRAEEARNLKKKAEEAKKITIDDLTKGIVNYKYLGLDFENTQGENAIRFSFSRLDENDPGKRCSFVLNVNDEEKFAISDCQPALESTEIDGILEEVNDTDSMAILATSMRHAFKRICTEEK
mmetsp:Transcript_15366/g.38095  ORF Transcript_15366/g.38095 Transcript_15366/m.38095 type:complete len:283 (-) Transcript_15366:5792-6640(-)